MFSETKKKRKIQNTGAHFDDKVSSLIVGAFVQLTRIGFRLAVQGAKTGAKHDGNVAEKFPVQQPQQAVRCLLFKEVCEQSKNKNQSTLSV